MFDEILKERMWEPLLKIHTCGRDATNADLMHHPYEPTPYCVLERLANSGWITKKNTLLDYGCGKGRVDFFLSHETKCKSIGIEYDERIFVKAVENKGNSILKRNVEFRLANAECYDVPIDVDRVYFFNPFSIEILKSVMNKILESYYEKTREILMFFYYPSTEYMSYLMTKDELMFVDEIDCGDLFNGNIEREKILIFQVV